MQDKSRIPLPSARFLPPRIILLILVIAFSLAQSTFAQDSYEQVTGIKNFGRVTETYFRGGAITPEGISNLTKLGVRTIIDLRDSPNPDEPAVCQHNGIKYFNFPMTGHDTPSDKAVSEILSIIQNAKEPVYVHCSAGKHRAGTIAALYRTRVQGWSPERAWAEQKSYGFGSPEEHPQLYAYVYGKQFASAKADVAQLTNHPVTVSDEEKSSKKKKKKNDDDDDSSKAKKKKKKDDDAAKGKDHSMEMKREDHAGGAPIVAAPAAKAASDATAELVKSDHAGLSAAAQYISLADAIKRANDEGGKGNVLKIDLEWDTVRSVVTWDVTLSSGAEYELDATSGKLLGTKSKAPAKLATLEPLALDSSGKGLLTFQEIIRKAEASSSQTVMEMELKQIKGRSEIVFEVVLADGTTLNYDATTGNVIAV